MSTLLDNLEKIIDKEKKKKESLDQYYSFAIVKGDNQIQDEDDGISTENSTDTSDSTNERSLSESDSDDYHNNQDSDSKSSSDMDDRRNDQRLKRQFDDNSMKNNKRRLNRQACISGKLAKLTVDTTSEIGGEMSSEQLKKTLNWINIKRGFEKLMLHQKLQEDKKLFEGSTSDNIIEGGLILLKYEYERSDVHIVCLGISQIIFNSEIYRKPAYRETNKDMSPLTRTLLLFPVVAYVHYSLVCFWRLDLLCTTDSHKSCILWLDSSSGYHHNQNPPLHLRHIIR